ncbi:uncharacterized protein LOC135574620 [Oncorhynchus nerka]|uniref:uncharacterized protein LOC135574620 n=1 Tax=Oncorhynchus nerka TaxID=8023 RepID=UPI0031B8AB39
MRSQHGSATGTRGSPPKKIGGGHTRCGTKPGSRPELTPRVYDKQRITGQAPCYAVKRTVSPVRAHSPVRYRAAPRKCHASVGIEPGRMVPAQRVWSPVLSFGPGYPAPALRAVSPGRWEGAVRPLPALRSCRANVGVEPKGEVRVVSTRSPVLTHSPVQPVPALWRVRARVVVQPGEVVPRLHTRAPVLPHSPVLQAPPNTKPPEGLPSLVVPVAAPRTRLSLCLLPAGGPVCPAPLPQSPACPAPLPQSPACPAPLPQSPACPAPLPESEAPEPLSPEAPEPLSPEAPEPLPLCPEPLPLCPEPLPLCPELLPLCPELLPLCPELPLCPVGSLRGVAMVRKPRRRTIRRTKTMVKWGPRPAPEPPPRTDAHPDPPL